MARIMADHGTAIMGLVPPPIPLPDPPLVDGVVQLRPWGADDVRGDAEALAAAWSDPEVQRWSAVPASDLRGVDHAERWIRHEADRRRKGLAIDLVISPFGHEPRPERVVLGEVGLAPIDWQAMEANVGWWVEPGSRGRGVATRAVTLLAAWARSELGLTPTAVVDPANRASVRVARRGGVQLRA
jgi:[ribosomal protein S5]-alanine N-acetyltransferase